MGTADFYAVVEGFDAGRRLAGHRHHRAGRPRRGRAAVLPRAGPGRDAGRRRAGLRAALRSELSPRHVPDRFIVVDAIPRTLNGKKCEVPVKKILAGVDPEKAVSRARCRTRTRWPPSSSWPRRTDPPPALRGRIPRTPLSCANGTFAQTYCAKVPFAQPGGARGGPEWVSVGVRRVADRFDVVAVRVADERAVVVVVVLGPDARLVQRLRPGRHGRRVEGPDPLGVLGGERDVRLPVRPCPRRSRSRTSDGRLP